MKFLFLAFGLMFAVVVNAAPKIIQFVYYMPPGGGTDVQSNLLIPELSRQGVTVKKVFLKSCTEAINYTLSQSDAFLLSVGGDIRTNDHQGCKGRASNPELKFYSMLGSTPCYICATRKQSHLTLKDIETAKAPLLLGVQTRGPTKIVVERFLQTAKTPLNIKLVPYVGGGDLNLAVQSNNVDLFYGCTYAAEQIEQGAVCYIASAKDNWAKLPHMSEFSQDPNFPNTAITTDVWYNKNIDVAVDTALKKAMASREFLDGLAARKSAHFGLGRGISTEVQFKNMQQQEQVF